MSVFLFRNKRAFSIIEMLTVMGIIVILFSLTVPQLFRLRDRNNLQTATTKLISLIRQQQLNAMNSPSFYGIYFNQSGYTQFTGSTYIGTEAANIISTLDYPLSFSLIDIPNSTLVFASGSGEVVGYDPSHNSIELEQTIYHEKHTILFNSLGVPIGQ